MKFNICPLFISLILINGLQQTTILAMEQDPLLQRNQRRNELIKKYNQFIREATDLSKFHAFTTGKEEAISQPEKTFLLKQLREKIKKALKEARALHDQDLIAYFKDLFAHIHEQSVLTMYPPLEE